MKTFTVIENRLIEILDKVAEEANLKRPLEYRPFKSEAEWTKRIKELICEHAVNVNPKCGAAASGFKDKFDPEWLYDIVWYTRNADKHLDTIPLVVESEWNRNLENIMYDFEKLLLTNAEHRLFICQAKPNQLDEFRITFKKAVSSYNHLNKGDRFLIAILDDYGDGDFKYELIVKE